MSDVPGHPDLAVKTFAQPIDRAAEGFERVRTRGLDVINMLGTDDYALCIPREARIEGGCLVGYVMPKLPPEFYFDVATGRGKPRRTERSLSWALPRTSAFTIPFIVTDADRLALVKLIARWLHAMHEHDLVYGDLSWANLAFSVDQKPRIAVFDFDQTRVVGDRAFTGMPPAHTVDWNDPFTPDGPATIDTDRYKFALLAFRMLVSKDLHSDIDPDTAGDRPARVRSLWRRACGPWGTRPSLAEWVEALATT